jgi:cytochrome oxidase Cu insertion factor (SCO1/SenC/PrrC family)
MKTLFSHIFIFTCILTAWSSHAQNNKVENFTLTNLQTGAAFSLTDTKDVQCVVIVVTSAYCPYSKSYKERIIKLSQQLEHEKQSVKLVMINPDNEQDSEDAMKAEAKTYALPYLWDKGNTVTTQLQAAKTPEVFVLQQSLGHFILKYHGAIDDNPQVAAEVTKPYLMQAIQACLEKGNVDAPFQKPTGCLIKK